MNIVFALNKNQKANKMKDILLVKIKKKNYIENCNVIHKFCFILFYLIKLHRTPAYKAKKKIHLIIR